MNVAVLLAGIADPKWPLGAAQPRILSPFDESALEVALKLRDGDPATSVSIVVAGDEALGRVAAAHRPDHLRRVEIPPAVEWDLRAQASLWGAVIPQLPVAPDLVVMGREFGDRDDGALPACLAETLGWRFARLVQEVRVSEGGVEVMRERGDMEERIALAPPLVASVTNDRRNKLRHPLMKNVMAAKRAAVEKVVPGAVEPRVRLDSMTPATAPVRASRCRMLEGSIESRVAALAEALRGARS